MRILFVIYELDFADHIAISYLSAIAKQLKHSTYFCCLKDSDLTEKVEEVKPDVVAYSVNVVGFKSIVDAHKKAKMKHEFVSILGGPQATFSPETFPESEMDAYCVGEGEYAFRDFLVCLEKKEPFDDVENLITKKKSNPVRPLIKNLDELPPADRDLILTNSHLKTTAKKTFYATRGCPFKCAYCCNNYYHELYKGKGTIVRRFSVERVIAEIEDVKSKYRMDFLKFGDDLFAMKADEWLEEFTEKYSKRIGIPFNCYLRLDIVSDDLLKLLKQAGCFSVHLSVDSLSKHVRDNILKRRMRSENIIENLRKIEGYGINTWVNYMLAAPESTLEEDLETIWFSKKAKLTYPTYSTTLPMEGTELYDYCVKNNIIDPLSHSSDLKACSEKSTLKCFSEKEKNIRFNIFLLGTLISKLPFPLDRAAFEMIKIVPPNKAFRKIRELVHNYYLTNKIFKLPKGA